MAEIPNVWTLLGIVVVLSHQAMMMLWQTRAHRDNREELAAIQAELTECRGRWNSAQLEIGRLRDAVAMLARGLGRNESTP
jgi:hypothetical protein